jgi:hypothetical protein
MPSRVGIDFYHMHRKRHFVHSSRQTFREMNVRLYDLSGLRGEPVSGFGLIPELPGEERIRITARTLAPSLNCPAIGLPYERIKISAGAESQSRVVRFAVPAATDAA